MLLEIEVLRTMKHPNVIELYEVYESSKYIHLLLPYLEGGELFERIKAKGLYKESDAVRVMHSFISALKYLCELKVVHRDLKPENLLLDYDKTLKIVDFGLSNMYERNETLKTACGSPCYAAPEVRGIHVQTFTLDDCRKKI